MLIRSALAFSARLGVEKMQPQEAENHVNLCKMLCISINEGTITGDDAQLIAGALEAMIRTLRRDRILPPRQRKLSIEVAERAQKKLTEPAPVCLTV